MITLDELHPNRLRERALVTGDGIDGHQGASEFAAGVFTRSGEAVNE